MVYGMWIDFFSSELWWRWGTYTAGLLTFASVLAVRYGRATGHLNGQAFASIPNLLLAYAALGVGLFCIWWMVVVRVIPDTIAILSGEEFRFESGVYVKHRRGRGCDYRLEEGVLNRSIPGYICTSPTFAPSPSRQVVIFYGKHTPLGFHITRYEIRRTANNTVHSEPDTNATRLKR